MTDKPTLRNLSQLEYSQLWLDSGILTKYDLTKQIEEFKTGEDTNKEHYRYRTFGNFINRQSFIDDSTLQQIIEILKMDNDKSMASSATIKLLKTKYLTDPQFDEVLIFLRTFGDWTLKHIDKLKQDRLS